MRYSLLILALFMPTYTDVPLWTDTFESGVGITTNYQSTGIGWDTIIETANGIGVGGGWGIQSKGSASDKYSASFRKRIPTFTPTTASEGALGYIEFDDDLAYLPASAGDFAFTHLEWVHPVSFSASYLFGTLIGQSGGSYGGTTNFIEIYDFNFDIIGAFDNAIIPGSYHRYRFEFQTSSWNGSDWNTDGWVKFYRDGVLIGTATGGYLGFDNSAPVWSSVGQYPIGHLDNFEFGEMVPVTPTPTTPPVILVNSIPSCATPANGSSFAGDIHPVGPGWTPSCAGGGSVPTATDITLAEAWDF